ncbi:MAG: EcsC family protein [Terrisporobacter sp.]
MDNYLYSARLEHEKWKKQMRKRVSIINKITTGAQSKFNNMLPDKYHEVITTSIKTMVKSVLFGYKYITKEPYKGISVERRENLAKEKINFYKKTAMAEGAATGAGGFLLGLADLPLLLGIKVKLLYDIAAIYGFDVKDYRERLYILHIIQLAFSSQSYMRQTFHIMENWQLYSSTLPGDINDFNWRDFQQQYRDYLDLAKLFQLMPVIGAVVGLVVNGKLLDKLGDTAMNAYRMRLKEFE